MKSLARHRLLALILILLLAFLLRFVGIANNPPALYGDELTLVYDAYSIFKTGHDQTGKFLPLTFAMSEGRSPAYVYFSIPLVAVFGPNELSARLLSVFSGVLIVLLTFLLTRKLFGEKAGLISGALMAISPWDIGLSRGGFEAHFALLLALAGTYFALLAKKKPWFLLLSGLTFGLSIHAYHSYKLTLPLFLLLLAWYGEVFQSVINITKYRKYFISSVLTFGALVLVWLLQIGGGSDVRFLNTSIFTRTDVAAELVQKINTKRTLTATPLLISTLLHNRPLEYFGVLAENYLDNFSVDFLFIRGDGNPRHNPGLSGGFYLMEILLMGVGLVMLYQNRRREFMFLGGWVLIAPLATTVVSGPHALRSAFMLPPLVIISAFGLMQLIKNIGNRWSVGLLLFVIGGIAVQFIFISEQVYSIAPRQFASFWSYPAKQASEFIIENRTKYDYVIVSGQIDSMELAYPVYAKVDPKEVIAENLNRATLGIYRFKRLGNVYIGDIPVLEMQKFIKQLPGSVLYIGPISQQYLFSSYIITDNIDGLPAFFSAEKR